MMLIDNVDYVKESFHDSFGRVFRYNGEIYRAINNDAKESCIDFLQSELFSELMRLRYIPKTTIEENICIKGVPLILHHEKCEMVKPYEWTFEMYKDVAIFILEINTLCERFGYELKDAHPFNITFHNGQPVYFDLGSFEKKRAPFWSAKNEFVATILLPLCLWKDGNLCVLRALLESSFESRRLSPCQWLLDDKILIPKLAKYAIWMIERGRYKISTRSRFVYCLLNLFDYVGKLLKFDRNYRFTYRRLEYSIPSIDKIGSMKKKYVGSWWDNYHLGFDHIDFDRKFPRFSKIATLTSKYIYDARTMLDIAGNQGMFSFFMYKQAIFETITLTDYDENALNVGYSFFSKNNIPINVVWLNPINPLSLEDTTNRLKADVVFALAITHHLSLSQGFPFPVIFERFNEYTEKYIVVEYMPLGLWDGNSAPQLPYWYNKENFRVSFEKYFVVLCEEQLEDNRIIFIGKKNK